MVYSIPRSSSFTFLPFFSFVTVLVSLFELWLSAAGLTQFPIGTTSDYLRLMEIPRRLAAERWRQLGRLLSVPFFRTG